MAAAVALACATSASAVQRTFVSANGSDAGTCALATPCRTLDRAMTQTDWGGEVVALNSGGYGGAVINKPVSIIAPKGVNATIGSPSSYAGGTSEYLHVEVPGGVGRVVVKGWTIQVPGTGVGIGILAAGMVSIENCTIIGPGAAADLPGSGIALPDGGTGTRAVYVVDTAVRGFAYGFIMRNDSATPVLASIDRSSFDDNYDGVSVNLSSRLLLRRSTLSGNVSHGLFLGSYSATRPAHVLADQVKVAGNGIGVESSGTGGLVSPATEVSSIALHRSTLVNNGTGVKANYLFVPLQPGLGDGWVYTTGTSSIYQNGSDFSGNTKSHPAY